eukprot:760061-Hanusia_phi.AAC.5
MLKGLRMPCATLRACRNSSAESMSWEILMQSCRLSRGFSTRSMARLLLYPMATSSTRLLTSTASTYMARCECRMFFSCWHMAKMRERADASRPSSLLLPSPPPPSPSPPPLLLPFCSPGRSTRTASIGTRHKKREAIN